MSTAWSWLQPIERRALAAITHRYHHPQEASAVTPLAKLIEDIEHDIAHATGSIEGGIHDALQRHLTLTNVLGHAADAVAALAASPLASVMEAAVGLPPAEQGILARMAGALATELSHQAQLQPLGGAGGSSAAVVQAPDAPDTAATA